MQKVLLFLVLIGFTAPAWAIGFHAKNLWGVRLQTSALLGGSYEADSHAPNRVTLHCRNCDGLVIVDILLTDGEEHQEAKLRSGEMTLAKMQAGCAAWAEECSLRAHQIGNAVGWIEDYVLGGRAGTTARLYLDGQMLTIRSTAPDPDIAHGNGRAVIDAIAPLIVKGP